MSTGRSGGSGSDARYMPDTEHSEHSQIDREWRYCANKLNGNTTTTKVNWHLNYTQSSHTSTDGQTLNTNGPIDWRLKQFIAEAIKHLFTSQLSEDHFPLINKIFIFSLNKIGRDVTLVKLTQLIFSIKISNQFIH